MEEAQRARREFLARAGEALVSSLDYRTTLATVARLAVPELADWCSVDLVEPGTPSPSPVAIVHTESSMIVPLTHRGHVLGAMSFVYGDSGRRYTESDLAFAEDFARRAAMAIENAQAHAALGAALEFQERFVAVLGHDLRNPLGAIDMAAAVLRQRATMANDTATMHVLDRMRSSSTRMSRMIEQVLDLTRLRLAGGLALNPRPMDLRETLTRIVNELRMAHPSRSMVLRCESMCGTWDADRLEQVFSNLIANAVHYGAPDRPVTIDARLEDGAVRVEVHNEGEPIPEELRARLFDPFRRGTRESRHAKTAGLGLGLYICREIALAHRGCLDVQSSSPEGTTFRVTLPGGSPPPTAHCGDGSR
jgi:signal transduction histidine kinase